MPSPVSPSSFWATSAPVIARAVARSGDTWVVTGIPCVWTGYTALTEANWRIFAIAPELASIETPFHSVLKCIRSLYEAPEDFASWRNAAPSESTAAELDPSASGAVGNSTNQYFDDSSVIWPVSADGACTSGCRSSAALAVVTHTSVTPKLSNASSMTPRWLIVFILSLSEVSVKRVWSPRALTS